MLIWICLTLHLAHAQNRDVVQKIKSTRAGIQMDEHRQRELLARLFTINRKVKEIGNRQRKLNGKLQIQNAKIRILAREVGNLEDKTQYHRDQLNKRLRQLYQDRDGGSFHWLFMAQSPVELDRNKKFLELMVDSDHERLRLYLTSLHALRRKRADLKVMVAKLLRMQQTGREQEAEMSRQLNEKARLLAELQTQKAMKLVVLKDLRQESPSLKVAYAFFERKGSLHSPIAAPVISNFGVFVNPRFKFRLMRKGQFYSAQPGTPIHAIFSGKVAVAKKVPGYGKMVVLDHGDNYYTVYAFASQLKVHEGAQVQEGQLIAFSGKAAPLFGPGLYFEIRHFTDAIDPRPWIKEPVVKTANSF